MTRVPPMRGGHSCQTCDALAVLTGDDRDALVEWLEDRSVSTRMIHLALDGVGIKATKASIARHRREHPVE